MIYPCDSPLCVWGGGKMCSSPFINRVVWRRALSNLEYNRYAILSAYMSHTHSINLRGTCILYRAKCLVGTCWQWFYPPAAQFNSYHQNTNSSLSYTERAQLAQGVLESLAGSYNTTTRQITSTPFTTCVDLSKLSTPPPGLGFGQNANLLSAAVLQDLLLHTRDNYDQAHATMAYVMTQIEPKVWVRYRFILLGYHIWYCYKSGCM